MLMWLWRSCYREKKACLPVILLGPSFADIALEVEIYFQMMMLILIFSILLD